MRRYAATSSAKRMNIGSYSMFPNSSASGTIPTIKRVTGAGAFSLTTSTARTAVRSAGYNAPIESHMTVRGETGGVL